MPQNRLDDRRHPRSVRVAGRTWPVIGSTTIGRRIYWILEELGAADRERFMAFDPHAGPAGELRAILTLPRSFAAVQHVRVLQRVSANHINLPTILDYQSHADRIWLVLPWVRGPDLQTYINDVRAGRQLRPSAVEAFRLFRGLAHGLGQLHHYRQTVHGDIKPANLILASGPSRLVIIDFGSAWLIEHTTRRSEGDGFSAVYAAPEVHARRAFVDCRSDQFSASVVLYELLTLAIPYGNLGGKAAGLGAETAKQLVPPSRLSPDRTRLPSSAWRAIDEVTIRGLALDPDLRYSTRDAWLDAVDGAHADLQRRSRMGPTDAVLTRAVAWIAQRFRGR